MKKDRPGRSIFFCFVRYLHLKLTQNGADQIMKIFDDLLKLKRTASHFGAAVLAATALGGSVAHAASGLATLQVTPGLPLTLGSNAGTLNYTYNSGSNTGVFTANLDPSTTEYPPLTFVAPSPLPGGVKYANIGLTVDGAGNVVGGVSGHDFEFFGGADFNNDFVVDVEGVLLTGEIIAFGFLDSGTAIDRFDMRFRVTGGLLASYFTNKDLGVVLTPENSTFADSFVENFSATFVKAAFGPIPTLCVDIETEISVDGGTTWADADNVGDADVPSIAVPGGALYRYVVTNCGGTPLENAKINDPNLNVVDYPIPSLDPGVPVIVTPADEPELDEPTRCAIAGTLINNATVVAESTTTAETATDADPAVIECTTTPSLNVRKQISANGGATWFDADNVVDAPNVFAPHGAEYRFIVENDGTEDLTNVAVTDTTLGINEVIASLPQGGSVTIDKGDVPAMDVAEVCATPGEYPNIVTVSAAGSTGQINDDDPAYLVCIDDGTPAIELIEEISTDGSTWADANAPGDSDVPQELAPSDATYRITVTNTGNVDLVNVQVDEPTLGITDYTIPLLEIGETVIITVADIPELFEPNRCTNPGVFGNSANVDAVSANNPAETVSDADTAYLECVGTPLIDILTEITTNGVDWHDANDAPSAPTENFPSDAEYRYTVTNTGSADLINVVVNDPVLGISNYVVGPMAVGEVVVITIADIPGLAVTDRCTNSGTFINNASVDGESVDTGEVVSDADPATLVCIGSPAVTLVKEISVDGGSTWGDANTAAAADAPTVPFPASAEYRLTVRNTGNIELNNIVINDASLGVVNEAIAGSIPVGGELVITAADIPALAVTDRCTSAGEVMNIAQVNAAATDTGTVVNSTDPAVMTCVGTPHISIINQVSLDGVNWADADAPGDADVPVGIIPADAFYRYIVRNDGTADLTNVTLNDGDLGVAGYLVGDMVVGQEITVTGADIAALNIDDRCVVVGNLTNVVNVVGESVETGEQVTDSDPANINCKEMTPPPGVCDIDVGLAASFATAPPPVECAECDGKITTLTLRHNSANSAYIVVKQKKRGPDPAVFSGTVAPNSTFSFTGVDKKGTLGTEIRIFVDGEKVTSIHTSCSVDVLPGMDFGPFTVVEGASRNGGALCPVDGGNTGSNCSDVTFTYTVTNNGDAADVLLEDDTYDLGLGIFQLAEGESQQFTNVACLSADATNTATVTATLVSNGAISCDDTASTTVYCGEEEVWVQHCTNSSSGGQQCSLVKETQLVCDDQPLPPPPEPPVCEEVWVQHCTNSSSGGQQCTLVKENSCDTSGGTGGNGGGTAPPPAEGTQGCTPGYWKQKHHFGNWTSPYVPKGGNATMFSDVFNGALPGKTLRDALRLRGGGLKALARHTSAALLNAASPNVDYGMTTQQVVDAFAAAYNSGDYKTQKNVFNDMNEQGCPLGRAE